MKQSGKIFSKVKAAGLAGFIVTAIVFGLSQLGIQVDETVAAALVTIVSFLLSFVKVEKVGLYRVEKR